MKMKLLILFSLFSALLKAPDYKEMPLLQDMAVKPYEKIVHAVTTIESRNGIDTINKIENAVGWFGIRPIRLLDYNQRTGQNIMHEQCYNYETAKIIFLYYVSQCDYRDIKGMSIAWNGVSKENLYYKKILKVYGRI